MQAENCFPLVGKILLRQPDPQSGLHLRRNLYKADTNISAFVRPCYFHVRFHATLCAGQLERRTPEIVGIEPIIDANLQPALA